ncbi:MAG: fumarylacetoacetate hydrolase family protein [Gemmatimonadota bacterium]
MNRNRISVVAGLLAVAAYAGGLEAQQGVQTYVRFEQAGEVRWGHLADETIHPLTDAPYLGGSMVPGEAIPLSAVTLKAPVDPANVYMTAFNFRSHITGEPAPYPGIFIVPAGSIIGTGEDIIRPPESTNFHYEAELVAVIGRDASNVSVEAAGDYVFGVTAGNDGSERDWQANDTQWVRAKGTRTFNAVGPVLVTGLDYQSLDIEGRLNGEVRQGENSGDMLFGMDHMVSYISRYFPLKAGDLIWSGTMGTTQPMQPGDVYEVEIEGVGVLRNRLVQGQ